MADAKLTALTAASALAGADLFYISQGGVSKRATHTQLLTLVGTTYVPLAGGTMTGALTIASGTLTASAPALNITQTWNQGATQFESIAVDVTNTASGSSAAYFVGKTAGSINLRLRRDGYFVGTGLITANVNAEFYGPGIRIASGAAYSWCQYGTDSTVWVSLYGEAAGALAQRNGTTQQIFRLYNRYTDSSNFERLTLTGVAGTSVNITAETLGTGGDNLDIVLTPAGSGNVKFGTLSQIVVSTGSITGQNVIVYGTAVGKYAAGLRAGSTGELAFTSGADTDAVDTALMRNAAGIVEVNNGTAGTWRDLKLRNLLNTEYHQMTEMTAPSAPAANSVRIYAEDNGSGKTRLMALFATGAAQQIAIEP